MTVVDNLYIQNLEEYVLDEDRLVTYKWLSKTLEVHVNQAKQMLYAFVQQERNKKDNDQLAVTYFVSGVMDSNGLKTIQNQIVPEERLEAARSRLHPLTSCHIYSVHKAKVKDTNALYMSDLDIVKDQLLQSSKFSAIKCVSAKLRSSDEMSQLKSVAQPTTNAPTFAKATTQPSSTSTNKIGSKKPNAGIAGMFAASEKKKDEKPTKASPEKSNGVHKPPLKENTEKPSKTKPGGIGHFFGNQAAKPKKEIIENSSNVTQQTKPELPVKTQTSPPQTHKSPHKAKSPSPKAQQQKRRKKTEDSDDENEQQKKRRRIKAAVWSDSSEDEEEMETEPPPPSPPREPTPSPQKEPSPHKEPSPQKESSPHKESPSPAKNTSQKSQQNSSNKSSGGSLTKRRKRQKKMVSKTFMDDGGFMVTEKVFESCSESASDEELIPPTPPVKPTRQPAGKTNNQEKKSPHNKKSPASAGKQSTLMSFFKKK